MSEDLIRYDILTREALRGVVRKVLSEVSRTGLPGDHHFYISFASQAPGVRLPARLVERYPTEMTIVLQNQFWDLKVTEAGFEVGLSFDDRPETLHIPFAAILGFFDPSVEFGLKFEVEAALVTDDGDTAGEAVSGGDDAGSDDPDAPVPPGGDKVVSLDQFRKK
ncbi:MAG: SspB family protein [Alphaproteobacteria bacterium]|nr:SspB family protein [Alphaproteobacteria bacterium]